MTATLTLRSIVQLSSDHLTSPIDDEIVVMSMEHHSYYGLHGVAGDIWQRLEKPISVTALCDALAEEYEAERTVIERDVLRFVGELVDAGLVKVC